MNVSDLVKSVLGEVRRSFYGPERVKQYKQHERPLTKAILRYGKECQMNGWDLKPEDIVVEILKVLWNIRRRGGEYKYLPSYLEGAITRHVRTRAEELSKQSKALNNQTKRAMLGLQVVPETTFVEKMASAYQLLQQIVGRQYASRRKPNAKQQELL